MKPKYIIRLMNLRQSGFLMATAVAVWTGIICIWGISVSAATGQAVVGMPFSGKWAYIADVSPPYVDTCPEGQRRCPGLSSHPAVHHAPGKGDWAIDVYVPDKSIPEDIQVKLNVVYASGNLSFAWSDSSTSCGESTRIKVLVDGAVVGEVYFAHINKAVKSGPITNGMTIGTMKTFFDDKGNVCNPGPHVHIEFKNTVNTSCYVDNGRAGTFLQESTSLGVLGSTNTRREPCTVVPSKSVPENQPVDPNSIPLINLRPNLQGSENIIQNTNRSVNIQGPGAPTYNEPDTSKGQENNNNFLSKIINFFKNIFNWPKKNNPETVINAETCAGRQFSFVLPKGYSVSKKLQKCSSSENYFNSYELIRKEKGQVSIMTVEEFVPRGSEKPDTIENIRGQQVGWLLRVYRNNKTINAATQQAWREIRICQEGQTSGCMSEAKKNLYMNKAITGTDLGFYASLSLVGMPQDTNGSPEFALMTSSLNNNYLDDFKALAKSIKYDIPDTELIKLAYQEYGGNKNKNIKLEEFEVENLTIEKNKFAKGVFDFYQVRGPAAKVNFLAVKENGGWKILGLFNGEPSCSWFDKYPDAPETLRKNCAGGQF